MQNEKLVLLVGDVGTYGLRDAFAKYPDRCHNFGTAEQAMVGIAAGMAREGFYPVIHSFSTFLARRAYEQIYLDFGEQGLNGFFAGIGEAPKLGITHCCREDMDLMDQVRGMNYVDPTSPATLEAIMTEAVNKNRLVYARL